MMAKVSINLCCYNSEKYLRETLDSIMNQTYKDWELVIINDGSTDSTESIINEYIKQGYPIIYYYQENHGLGYSRNKAIEFSRGEYIAFIDHDDVWLQGKLEKQVAILKNKPSIDFLYTNYFTIKNNRKDLYLKDKQPEGFVFEQFILFYPVGILTVMVRKSILDTLGLFFDENLRYAEDYDLFIRLLMKSQAAYIDEALAIYRIHNNMSTIVSYHTLPGEMEYIIEKLIKINPCLIDKHLNLLNTRLDLLKAQTKIKQGDLKAARIYLQPYKNKNIKYFVKYLLTYFPTNILMLLYKIKH
jgi:glycosyltransferase involved in cell wall biosynthesis